MLQAALNGPLTKQDHPAVPITAEELARDAAACVAAGAGSVHLHPRDADGIERFDAQVVDAVVHQVRAACRVEVSVTTGAWIEPDVDRRVALIRQWRMPDLATVNVSEEGSVAVMEALLAAGVGVEAGIWTVEDVERLAESDLAPRVARVLIEPVELAPEGAVEFVNDIHLALDAIGADAPRLEHGDGDATWILIRDAVRRGVDTRVGLEDTIFEPDGRETDGNASLVRAARQLAVGRVR
jgi:uncharacterized protein (DUF849 family)